MPETRVTAEDLRCWVLTVCVCRHWFSTFHAIIFRKSHGRKPDKPARKQNLTRNCRSRSFKITDFGITEKPMKYCVSLCNISKVSKERASESAENCRCPQPHCRLTPPPQVTLRNISIDSTFYTRLCARYKLLYCIVLYRQKVESLGYTFLLTERDYLHSNFCGGLRKTHISCNRVHIGLFYRPIKVIKGRWFWHQSKKVKKNIKVGYLL